MARHHGQQLMKPKAASPSGKSHRGSSLGTTTKPKNRTSASTIAHAAAFDEVLHLIQAARHRAFQAANAELINLYWNVGAYVSTRIAAESWGKGTVNQLSAYIQQRQPGIRGFSASNIWRMRQFHDTYRDQPKLATMLRELPWSSNLHILNKCKLPEEREFYLRMALHQGWQVREVARQIDASLFERTVLSPPKLSTMLRELHPAAGEVFKDAYMLEFLGLPDEHLESDLHRALLHHLQKFITELGRDFCFIGSEHPIQVGGRDFSLDLLFFNRALNCLVAFELKIEEFQPAHLGQLNFYLEALDRDIRKPHENPSVGVLLCKSKDAEVVDYALSRSMSPAMIAEYKTNLPDRALLQRKLHEFYEQLALPEPPSKASAKR
jgi:predicted nuclease of restriction endonuclease-like (RecB) superfamily